MKYGYACVNTILTNRGVSTNRTLRESTLKTNGLVYYANLIETNIDNLLLILKWNEEHKIKMFRISSSIFPHKDKVDIKQLYNYGIIQNKLAEIGKFILGNGHRVSFHAEPYTILASQSANVVSKAINELEVLGHMFDLMGLSKSVEAKINLHIGTFKPDKQSALKRFSESLSLLSDSVLSRLTVENDDNPNAFSVLDLYNLLYNDLYKIPIVFDYYHHKFNPGGLSEESALKLAASTWPKDIIPTVHYSSSRKIHESADVKQTAHADYLYEKIQTYGLDLDIMIEAKMKEQALFRYLS